MSHNCLFCKSKTRIEFIKIVYQKDKGNYVYIMGKLIDIIKSTYPEDKTITIYLCPDCTIIHCKKVIYYFSIFYAYYSVLSNDFLQFLKDIEPYFDDIIFDSVSIKDFKTNYIQKIEDKTIWKAKDIKFKYGKFVKAYRFPASISDKNFASVSEMTKYYFHLPMHVLFFKNMLFSISPVNDFRFKILAKHKCLCKEKEKDVKKMVEDEMTKTLASYELMKSLE